MEIEKLAEILWKIHSHSLYPFYVEQQEFEEDWNTLEAKSDNSNEVDKSFFIQIARHIVENK